MIAILSLVSNTKTYLCRAALFALFDNDIVYSDVKSGTSYFISMIKKELLRAYKNYEKLKRSKA